MPRSEFQLEKFEGVVILKDWFGDPITGRKILGVAGSVSILEASKMTGFDVGRNEANWIARVEGTENTYNFPGCQVRCVVTAALPVTPNEASDVIRAG